jgi:hypothetical protein
MGRDLTSGSSLVVFRDGSFADGEHYFINHVGPITSASCYESKTGLPADCTRLEGRFGEAKNGLEVSDSIIREDLIPALREIGGQVRSRRGSGVAKAAGHCLDLRRKSWTMFDMSKDVPPWTGGYWASVFKCPSMSSVIGWNSHDTRCARWPYESLVS